MKRHAKSFWVRLVAEVRDGAMAVEVATRHRIRPSTLRWWCWRLRQTTASEPALRMLPVVTQAPTACSRHIEVALGSAALRVEEGTDVAYVVALARALRDAC
jgi:transposase-like protein